MKNNKSNIYVLAPLFLVLLIDAMGVGLVLPLFGPLFTGRTSGIVSVAMSVGMRDLLYGITLSIFCVFMFFGAPFLGDLSDHIGRKKVLLFCLFGTAFGLVICALGVQINSLFLLIAGRALAGFMSGSNALAQAAIVDISTEDNKAINLSLISLANCIGFVLGPIFGGLLSDQNLWIKFGVTTPFWVSAGLAFLNGILLFLIFKETFHFKKIKPIKITKGLMIFISAFTTKNKRIEKLAIVYLFSEMGWALYFQFLPLYLIGVFNYSAAKISHIMIFMGVVLGISFLWIIRIAVKIFTTEQIAFLSIAITAIGIFLAIIKTELMIWLSVIPIGVGGALFYVALLTLFSDSVDKNAQGWVMGVFATIAAVAWGAAGIFSGILGTFGLFVPFIVAGVLLLLGNIVLSGFPRSRE
jgi:DHA1 family tetracycline resistance protein-like MFS transporter